MHFLSRPALCFAAMLHALLLSVPANAGSLRTVPVDADSSWAAASQVVRGVVTDAVTGETLPAANILIAGTYRGTITNSQGEYVLEVDLPATIVVRYIGYATERRRISMDDPTIQDFSLNRVAIELQNVVVTGENPAVEIMREVIERKKRWRADLLTYTTEAYNRFTMSNDTGIVSIIETLTRAYWDSDDGIREVVLSKRETANMDLPAAMPAAMLVANLYDDDIDVAGHTIRGVTHPSALAHYRFTLAGTRYRDDQIVYDIDVEPRTSRKSGFVGRVSVLGEEYAMIDVELRPGDSFLFPPPIEALDATYQQQFDNFGGAYWLPVDFRSSMSIKVGFGALLAFPAIIIQQVSRFSGYEVNAEVPDSLFRSRRTVTVDQASVAADTLLDRPGSAVPLTDVERMAYAAIDSTLTLEKAYAPTGLAARLAKMSFGFSGGDGSGRRDSSAARRGIKLDPDFTPVLRYNRVDALFAGGMVNLDVGEHIRLGAGGGLSTGLGGDDRWSHSGSIRVESAGRNRLSVAMNYSSGTEPRYTTNRYGSFVNSIYTVLGGRDYFDYYRSEGFSGRVGFSPDFATVELTTGYNDERHTSLAQTTSYDLAASRPLRPNVAVDEGRLRSLVGHLAIGDDASGQVQAVTQRRIDMEAEWSPGSLGGDFDFAQYQISADWAFTTFYPRRLLPNVLQLRVIAGTSTGELPLQRRGIVDGGMSIYQPFGVLHTLDGRPYEGDSYLGVFWEHNFRTVPFELLGLYGPARRGYSILVFGGHGHTRLGGDVSGFRVAKDWHHEIGMSLSGILGVLRVDIAKRLDASGFAVGAGFARLF